MSTSKVKSGVLEPKKPQATRNVTKSDKDVYRCFYCDTKKHKSAFYKNDIHYCSSGISPICRDCAAKIANRVEYGVQNGMTIESLLLALRLMDKPFIQAVFDEADRVSKRPDVVGTNDKTVFGHYTSLLAVTKFWNSGWAATERTTAEIVKEAKDEKRKRYDETEEYSEIMAEAEINRKDSIRLIGYDVFASEPPEDRPLLYSQLIKYLDASPESNEDAMKVSSIVQIVKSYYQADRINNVISELTSDPQRLVENAATLKSLHTTQKTLMDTALSLAKDNGISLAHNNNNSKGASTLSGKLKKMQELNLREAEVNLFDIGTAQGMRQVADISNASIIDQIRLNENDIPEMLAEQRLLIERWERTAFKASEQARVLLRENNDLKDYIRSIGKGDILDDRSFVMDTDGGVNDEELYDEEFQKEMSASNSDVWTLEETQEESEILEKDRIDVSFEIIDDDDDVEVDPDDIARKKDSDSEE